MDSDARGRFYKSPAEMGDHQNSRDVAQTKYRLA
jgi:hypothetical protein